MEAMLSLTYLSSATHLLDERELAELLAQTRPRNEEQGLSGMLLYSDGNFIQVLEGPDDAVDETFARISADPRHHGILVMLREEITERAFPDWSMGFRALRREEVRELPGYSAFLADPSLSEGLTARPAASYQLLEIFRDNLR
jgi:hypothetical protein